MAYTDLFLLPLPKKNLVPYRKLAKRFGAIIREFGAIGYREFVQESMDPKYLRMLGNSFGLKKSEVVIFAYVDYPSKSVRNRAFKLMMTDERMKIMMTETPIFDPKRMVYGGFKQIFELETKKKRR